MFDPRRLSLIITLALACTTGVLAHSGVLAQEPNPGAFSQLMQLSDNTSGRISSFNREGRNSDYHPIQPGQTLELAVLDGAGIIRHFYAAVWGGEHYLRDLVLRAYWDGSDEPCVEVPFGDFFGLGHERPRFFTSLMVTVNPGDLGVFGVFGFNNYFPMPFARGARLTLTNEGTDPVVAVWYHIEFEKMKQLPPGLGRFHATWNRVNRTKPIGENINVTLHEAQNTTGADNYVVLDAEGHGTLAGIVLNIDNSMGNWYGEGDDMIFIDGEGWPPSYHGTGSEEIFGGGACPSAEYAGPYTGFHLIGNLDFTGKVSMYRWYINDLVRFRKSIRMTIEHGHANNIANDYSSTAFWYQDEPHKAFRPLPAAAERHPAWGDDPHDQAYRELIALRSKAFVLLVQAIRDGTPLPEDVARMMKSEISQTYFDRDYVRLHEQVEWLEGRLDELIAATAGAPPAEGAAQD
ncbi:MAG: glycoside hydrolase family 172 protein [Xanthomonadales bacterium]|nr:glycoside hydrolase family 172 protein [Xanthomonadales bacterium]